MFLTCLIFFSVILLAWKAQPVSPDPWTGTPGMCIPFLELFLTSWTSKYSSPGPYIHSQPFPFGPHSCKDVCIYLIVETGEVFSDWELKVLVKSSTWIFVRPGFELCTLRLCWIGIIKCEAFKANLPVAPPPPKKPFLVLLSGLKGRFQAWGWAGRKFQVNCICPWFLTNSLDLPLWTEHCQAENICWKNTLHFLPKSAYK